ncbi:MAG: nickel pincer cofactor biosynthesis protein LarB [Candidatus Eisenbacteria bacterium]|nr:nickel pincer cofactor biosynthesis protein LarB [Candidatus Eisenbacteria bacterium]
MNPEWLRALLERVRSGERSIEQAIEDLRDLPYEDVGHARIDHHRALRTGYPEAVYCEGKTPEQVAEILERLASRHPRVLGTRANAAAAEAARSRIPDAVYHPLARMIVVRRDREREPAERRDGPYIVVCAAGTSDLPVAEEAALTAETLGSRVVRLWDVGVAGIHRLLEQRSLLAGAGAIVAVAGMEGAMPGIVAGLAGRPVIAVPTSVGYGANLGGIAALLTMINSCAPGVSVVNIDNGFGAGFAAHLIVGAPGMGGAPAFGAGGHGGAKLRED